MRYPEKGTCTHQFPETPEGGPSWNGCGNTGMYVETCDGVPQYRCPDHASEWIRGQFDYALTEHKRLRRIVAKFRIDDLDPDILDRIERDEIA